MVDHRSEENVPLTIGDVSREPEFQCYSRRQIEYAIQQHKIRPRSRAGIIRLFGRDQLPEIIRALHSTARVGS